MYKKHFWAFTIIWTILLVAVQQVANATHNRAGEIRLEQIGELTLRATIITYTKASSVDADRDSLTIMWGDGNSEVVGRVNGGGNGEIIGNDIKMNIYIAEHTYPGRATYTVSMMDPNRIGGIQNVNFPNSIVVPFYIESTYTFLNPQFQGFNNSVVLLNPPLDFACVGKRFIHNPNAYDPDGDSLSFELVVPMQTDGEPVPRYEFPNQVEPGPNNSISLDPVTGDFVWDAPQRAGEYNIAIRINEYRNGNLINYTIRDMQINVRDTCRTTPPIIEARDEVCVIAGDTISENVIATDPNMDPSVLISLSAAGGPFEQEISPARFDVNQGFQEHPVEGKFTWETHCNHISDQEYGVIFKAENNNFQTSGLVELKQFRIKVVGPPPENLRTEGGLDNILLRWDQPFACEVTENDYFVGFTIWRKTGVSELEIDSCGTNPEDFGFQAVGFGIVDQDDESYFFVDETVEQGQVYCYRITAEFARRTEVGNHPYNRVQSLPSNEACDQLGRDLPLILEVSVEETDVEDGQINVTWTRPDPADLDTLEFPGPYRYLLLRSPGLGTENFEPVPGADFTANTFAEANDTSFTDTGIDTENTGYTYTVAFFTGESAGEYGRSVNASSVYLQAASANRRNTLSWEDVTPWQNYNYRVFLSNREGDIIEELGQVEESGFVHENLENGQEYCYYVESEGTYGLLDITAPLFNKSQVLCAVPLDTIPPCPPFLEVDNICSRIDDVTDPADVDLQNYLSWTIPECEDGDPLESVETFLIFFAESTEDEFELVAEVGGDVLEYTHQPPFGVTGCYQIQAIDSTGNISELSNEVCKSNCPIYNLPNAFTPNGDGFNDLFVPFEPFLFVERVNFEVYNRWGQKVFETNDPELKWDGTNMNGSDLSEGTYHYRARVFFRTATDVETSQVLNGYITLIR